MSAEMPTPQQKDLITTPASATEFRVASDLPPTKFTDEADNKGTQAWDSLTDEQRASLTPEGTGPLAPVKPAGPNDGEALPGWPTKVRPGPIL